MSSKGHTLDSKWSLALAIWSLLVEKRLRVHVFFSLPVCNHMRLSFLYMQLATQVCSNSLTYFQLLFPAPSLASLKFNEIQAENLLKH